MISLLSGNQKERIPSKETAHEDLGCYLKTESQEKMDKSRRGFFYRLTDISFTNQKYGPKPFLRVNINCKRAYIGLQ